METKIEEMEKTVNVGKDRRDLLSEKKRELEEILNRTIQKKKEVVNKRILLVNKKLLIDKALNNKTKEASDATQASQISQQKPDLDSPEVSFERIIDLTNKLHEYSQFMENSSQILDQMRSSLSEKTAKVNELQEECEQIDKLIRDQISKQQKTRQIANAKLIALKVKKKALDEKTFSLSMDVQNQQIRFAKLSKDMENLDEKFGVFMARFQEKEK